MSGILERILENPIGEQPFDVFVHSENNYDNVMRTFFGESSLLAKSKVEEIDRKGNSQLEEITYQIAHPDKKDVFLPIYVTFRGDDICFDFPKIYPISRELAREFQYQLIQLGVKPSALYSGSKESLKINYDLPRCHERGTFEVTRLHLECEEEYKRHTYAKAIGNLQEFSKEAAFMYFS